jgi:hypothetical protein
MKHTKGPWGVSSGVIVISKEGRLISNCFDLSMIDDDQHTMEESIANAHLISAGPELLEACKDIAVLLEIDYENEDLTADAIDILLDIRNAISKAEGKQ